MVRLAPPTIEEQRDHSAEDEPSDVRPPRDSTNLAPEASHALERLQHEPEPQHDHRGELSHLKEEEDRDEGQNPGMRKHHQIGAERPGDRSGRADERNRGVRVGEHLGVHGDDAGGQVEQDERDPSHAVLDVVSEHPQVQHVAGDVQESPVKEHRGEDRHDRRFPSADLIELGDRLEIGDLFRDRSVTVEEDLLFLRRAGERLPQEEGQEVQCDDP